MSQILCSLISKKLPDWNTRVFTEDDALTICRAEGVCVSEQDIRSRGEYLMYKDAPFIVVKRALRRNWRAWVIWHELGHHWLHYPGPHAFSRHTRRKMDWQANFVAAIALIPTVLWESSTPADIMVEYGYPKELLKLRAAINARCRQ
jgi:Zn-dependent peptidase ImmA (M78 family)